jgi:hypothetical protein
MATKTKAAPPLAPTGAQARKAALTTQLCDALGLPELNATDIRRLMQAITEAAAKEITHNPEFAHAILTTFADLRPAKALRLSRVSEATSTPAARHDASIEETDALPRAPSYIPPDPKGLLEEFGETQLPHILGSFPISTLKSMLSELLRENPSVTVPNENTKAAIIQEIVKGVHPYETQP